jgi:hypothetical protein
MFRLGDCPTRSLLLVSSLIGLILWLGEHQVDPAEPVRVPVPEVEAWIGARIHPKTRGAAFLWLSEQKEAAEFFERNMQAVRSTARLTMAGWTRYEELKRGRIDSRKAFMAMKFNKPIVESAYSNCAGRLPGSNPAARSFEEKANPHRLCIYCIAPIVMLLRMSCLS